jgi:L-fuconate dehydratase
LQGTVAAFVQSGDTLYLHSTDGQGSSAGLVTVVIGTSADDGHEGHGFAFTIGRGNDVQVAAIELLKPYLLGREVEKVLNDLGGIWRELVHDSQLRWLGPEKGIMHMAISAVVNALWDLRAKLAGLPLWQLVAELPLEEIVKLVDFRYLTDALTPDEALIILHAAEPGRAERAGYLLEHGYPADITSPGWLGYSDDKLRSPALTAVADGFTQIKLKVGADLADDVRRLRVARAKVGPDMRIAIDAKQRWDLADAITWIAKLAPFDPYWIEEPTSPDDIVAHAAIRKTVRPIQVATGEHAQTASSSNNSYNWPPSTSCRSTPHASEGSTRTSRSSSSPPNSVDPSARTRAESNSAKWCNTCNVRLHRGQWKRPRSHHRVGRPHS